MAITSTYPIIVPKATDLIVGTQTYTTADPVLDNPTRNFTVQSLVSLVTGLVPGGGTVTSVAATGSNGISIIGSPITDEGTLTLSLTDGGVPITKLASSAITINGTSVSLGGSITVGGAVTSLTTTGTSGVATLASGILNIPNYTTNTGTVTSVDLSTDIGAFIVAANPITSAGTITLNLNGGTAGQFLRQDGTWAAIPGGNPGTVESVSGTGTVSGLTLTGTVTSSGDLTLGGTLALTSANVTTGLGFTPYNATNPAGYTTNTGTVTSVQTTNGAGISTSVANSTSAPNITITNTDLGSSQNIFKNFAVSGQTTIAADSNDDALTLVAGTNVTITTDATTDSITINAASVTNTFATDITVNGVLVGAGSNVNADENTRIGKLSLGQSSGNFNTAVGWSALRYNTTGQYNTAIGNASMSQYTISGSSNVGVGYRSLRALSSGLSNVAVGNSALVAISGGSANVAIGSGALDSLVNSDFNVSLGSSSLGGLVAGERNVAMGSSAGGTNRNNLNDSVFVGHGSSSNSDGQTNQIVIGATATGNGSNTVTLGNSSITDTYLKGNVNIPGDLEVTGGTTGVVGNNTDTYTGTAKITQIVSLSQAQYDAIASPLASTLYIIL